MNNCKLCNKEISNKKVYCNVTCMTIDYNKNKVIIKCIVCGKEKLRSKSQSNYKFCSHKCYIEKQIGSKRPSQSNFMKGNKLNFGRKLAFSHRLKISGDKSPRWRGGVTQIKSKLRSLPEYKSWRKSVYSRDKYTCQVCFDNKNRLEAHHIKHVSFIIKEYNIKTVHDVLNCKILFDISNGVTLCKKCHINIHKND